MMGRTSPPPPSAPAAGSSRPVTGDGDQGIARSVAVTSIAQFATMAIGGLLAIFILLEFGKNARTDGLLAAYGLYTVIVLFAYSFRTTAVARLLDGSTLFASFDAFLGGVLVVILVSGVAFVGLGDVAATVLTGDLGATAHDTARITLAILWPAAGAQLVAALAAATLGARGDFVRPGAAYVSGGVVSLATAIALSGPAGTTSVPIGLATGGIVACALMLFRLAQLGYRPRFAAIRPRSETLRVLSIMFGGAVAHLAVQIMYVVSLAFAARINPGDVTLYSYGFLLTSLVIGVTGGSLAMVLAAPIADRWDRRPRSLDPHLRAVVRAGLIVILPAVGLLALVGTRCVLLVLGASLTSADAHTVVVIALALSGMMLASVVEPVPMLAAFAAGRYLKVAGVVAVAVAVQVAADVGALATGDVAWLGACTSIGALAYVMMLLAVVYRSEVRRAYGIVVAELSSVLPAAALTFIVIGLVAREVGGDAAAGVAAVLAVVSFVGFLRMRRREHWALIMRLRRARQIAADAQ